MPVGLSEMDDLDFTDTVVMRDLGANRSADAVERILRHLDVVVDSIALKVELGSTDARLWRILAGFYLAAERIGDYNDLVRKHLVQFGYPLRIDQPPVSFVLPVKVNFDDVPKLEMIRSACASPGGAVVDFSAVRRLSSGGLIALSDLFGALAAIKDLPQLRGLDGFIESIEGAIKAGHGTREMQDLMASFRRYSTQHSLRQEEPGSAAA